MQEFYDTLSFIQSHAGFFTLSTIACVEYFLIRNKINDSLREDLNTLSRDEDYFFSLSSRKTWESDEAGEERISIMKRYYSDQGYDSLGKTFCSRKLLRDFNWRRRLLIQMIAEDEKERIES